MNLLTNGDFESGDFTGWDIHYGAVKTGKKSLSVDYSTVNPGQPFAQVVSGPFTFPGLAATFTPASGAKMALINDIVGGEHATCLHQTVTLPQDFEADCGYVSFAWTAVLVGSGHIEKERPKFEIDINYKKGGIGDWVNFRGSKIFISPENNSGGWVDISPTSAIEAIWKASSTETIPLGGLLPGDTVRIRFVALDCLASAHGGAAFVDSVVMSSGCDNNTGTISYDPLPNVFSPNGDGVNDIWGIRDLVNACSVEFELFDRWGDRVFYFKSPRFTPTWPTFFPIWDGKIRTRRKKRGSGLRKHYYSRQVRSKDTNSGVMYYMLKLRNCDGLVEVPGFFHVFV